MKAENNTWTYFKLDNQIAWIIDSRLETYVCRFQKLSSKLIVWNSQHVVHRDNLEMILLMIWAKMTFVSLACK